MKPSTEEIEWLCESTALWVLFFTRGSLVTAAQSLLATIFWFGLKEVDESQAGGRAAVIYPGAALLHFYTPPAPVGIESSLYLLQLLVLMLTGIWGLESFFWFCFVFILILVWFCF